MRNEKLEHFTDFTYVTNHAVDHIVRQNCDAYPLDVNFNETCTPKKRAPTTE